MTEQLPQVWFTLDADPTTCLVQILGFGHSEADCHQHHARTTSPYCKSFHLNGDMGLRIQQWLQRCGVPLLEAQHVVRNVGRELLRTLEETKHSEGS